MNSDSAFMRHENSVGSAPVETEPKFRFELIENPEFRKLLKHRVDQLVDRVHNQHDDCVVFLDKSARPISWLFKALWANRFPADSLPQLRFINVGTGHQARTEPGRIPAMDQEQADYQLQQTFGNQFDDKSVLIVDEVRASGQSAASAENIMRHAFSKAKQINHTFIFDASEVGYVPWMIMPGVLNIVDLDDELLVRRLDEQELENLKDRIASHVTSELHRARLRDFVWQVDGWEALIKRQLGKTIVKYADNRLLFDIRDQAQDIGKTLQDLLSHPPSPNASKRETLTFVADLIKVRDEINTFGKQFPVEAEGGDRQLALVKLRGALREAELIISGWIEPIYSLSEEDRAELGLLGSDVTLATLKQANVQLRKEITAIAEGK